VTEDLIYLEAVELATRYPVWVNDPAATQVGYVAARLDYEAATAFALVAGDAYRAAQAEVVRTGEAFITARETARKGTA
jgi:hypothetical protein